MSVLSEPQTARQSVENTWLGWSLRGWLAFMMLANIWLLYRYYDTISDLVRHGGPRWEGGFWLTLPVLAALGCANLLGLAGIWFRQIAGVYVVAAVSITAAVVQLAIGVPVAYLAPSTVGLAILFILLEANGVTNILSLANPSAFMRVSGAILPWIAALTAVLFAVGLTMSFRAPPDYQQGETARIMFIHVPSAWLSMACYTLIAISSAGYLIWRHPLADVSAKAAAPIGATFTLLALLTGSLWGKPMWGAYWVWDARLTSVLILFFLYLGLIALRQAIDDPGRAGRAAAILSLVGAVNIPIIKFSVNWWNTLHQPASVLRASGSTIHPALLAPLLVMAVAFTVLFIALHMKAMRAEILRRRCEAMIAIHVRGGGEEAANA